MAFGESLTLFIHNEDVVKKSGLREIQQLLEDAVDVGGREEVLAPGDVGDFLGGVIDDDGEMIGGAEVLAGKNDVA